MLGDTHLGAHTLDRMPPEVWELAAAADLVLHAGDVVEQAVLDALSERAPVHAVLGNNDHGLEAGLPQTLELDLDGVRVAMVHDSGARPGRASRLARRFPDAQVVVFGHSHDPLLEQAPGGPLLVNPGSPTHRRRQPVHTLAWLELVGGVIVDAQVRAVGPLAEDLADGARIVARAVG